MTRQKYLIVFRGDYDIVYDPNKISLFRGTFNKVEDPTKICINILKYIIEPLHSNNIDTDIIFCTYQTNLDKLKIYETYLKPIKIIYTNNGQNINFKESLMFIKDIYDTYDYIIFLRFDVIYKMNIIDWNISNKDGLILPFKEDSEHVFKTKNYYGDVIIIIHKLSYLNFLNAFNLAFNNHLNDYIVCGGANIILHNLVSIVQKYNPNTNINTIVDGYYQSNTGVPENDIRLSPIYIQVKYTYYGSDKSLYLEYL